MERVKTTMLRLVKKSVPHSIQNHTAPLPVSAHTQTESCCHGGSISEPAAIKITWLRAKILLLAGQFWSMGHLLSTTALEDTHLYVTPGISRTGIFVAIANNTLYRSKSYIFILCQKLLRNDVKIMFHEDM